MTSVRKGTNISFWICVIFCTTVHVLMHVFCVWREKHRYFLWKSHILKLMLVFWKLRSCASAVSKRKTRVQWSNSIMSMYICKSWFEQAILKDSKEVLHSSRFYQFTVLSFVYLKDLPGIRFICWSPYIQGQTILVTANVTIIDSLITAWPKFTCRCWCCTSTVGEFHFTCNIVIEFSWCFPSIPSFRRQGIWYTLKKNQI
jgi:hypothetical protein